jgi:hypothetical protein
MMVYYADLKKDKLANYWKMRAEKLDREQEQRYIMESKGLDPEGNLLPNYYQDAQGRVLKEGTMYDKKGRIVKIPTGSSAGKKGGGLTENAKNEILQRVLAADDDIEKQIPALAAQKGWLDILNFKGPLTPQQQKKKLAARSQVARALWQRYSPMATTPAAKSALRKMISRLLDAYVAGGAGGTSTSTAPAGGNDEPNGGY